MKWILIPTLQLFAEGGSVGGDTGQAPEATRVAEGKQQTGALDAGKPMDTAVSEGPDNRSGIDAKETLAPPALSQTREASPEGEGADPARDTWARFQVARWVREAEEAQRLYPGLNLEKELLDPAFRRLLGAGVKVEDAYLVGHKDQILPAVMGYAAQAVEKALAGKLRAQGLRPPENGLHPQGTAVSRPDVRKMTKADRESIRKRVAKGEKIRF